MMYKTIKYEKKDKVALITLNRPERLNAWTPLMSSEQVSAITHANEDSNIGSITFILMAAFIACLMSEAS